MAQKQLVKPNMLIFWKERLVFLATPKTGSTSIETALESLAHVAIQRPPSLKHMSARKYNRHFAPLLNADGKARFTTVALMREPIDWLGSWYRYRQRPDIPNPARSTKALSFDAAAQSYIDGTNGGNLAVGSQGKFLGLEKGRTAVDQVFRYEAIDQFVHFLEDRLDCEITLPRLNVSPKASLELSAHTEAQLRERLADDLALYASLA
ncbi:MAG: hypothetical protein WBH04_11180 [Albidovulum sp.]